MDVCPIQTEADHRWALDQVTPYFDHEPAPGTPEAARFSVLSTLIEAYEDETCPIEMPDPADALPEILAWRGLNEDDLGRILGSPAAAAAILARKAALTIDQARILHEQPSIPADLLLRPAILAAK